MKHRKLFIIFKIIYISIMLGIAFFCFYKFYSISKERKNMQEEYEHIIDIAEVEEREVEENENKINFEELEKVNSDIVGWITIEDTNINYPIVQGKDNTYYLKHSFSKEYSNYGAIYMDATANDDFSSLNTFIYGHNTSNSSMFGELKKFMKQSFYDEHRNIYIYTKDKNYKLEIFSVHIDTASSKSYQMNFTTIDAYKKYIVLMKEESVISSDVEIDYDNDKIVTLYSCSHERGNSKFDRYFIHAIIKEMRSI